MSKEAVIYMLHELEALGSIVQVDNDEALTEALGEIAVEFDEE